eukprot:3787259-Pleurochrysis_carterae.AAC.4
MRIHRELQSARRVFDRPSYTHVFGISSFLAHLHLHRGIEAWLHQVNARRRRQCQPHVANLDCRDEHLGKSVGSGRDARLRCVDTRLRRIEAAQSVGQVQSEQVR